MCVYVKLWVSLCVFFGMYLVLMSIYILQWVHSVPNDIQSPQCVQSITMFVCVCVYFVCRIINKQFHAADWNWKNRNEYFNMFVWIDRIFCCLTVYSQIVSMRCIFVVSVINNLMLHLMSSIYAVLYIHIRSSFFVISKIENCKCKCDDNPFGWQNTYGYTMNYPNAISNW